MKNSVCSHCKRPGKLYFKHMGHLCQNCFINIIEKRIRKDVRIHKAFKNNDKILVLDELSYDVVKNIVGNSPKEIFIKKIKAEKELSKLKIFIKNKRINKIVLSKCIDDLANGFLLYFFEDKKEEKIKMAAEMMDIFETLTSNELDAYSEAKKLKYIRFKKAGYIRDFLDDMDRKYPGAKFNLIKMRNKISGYI